MLKMAQIDQIKELQQQHGLGPSEIAERLGVDRKTVRKHMSREDFNEEVPVKECHPSKLDRWKPTIDEWLAEDERMRFKQRHTAKRVHQRLREEHPHEYDCSYPIVQRYVKQRKAERKETRGALELVWYPGEAQADFGEADLIEGGVRRVVKYLVLSFPHSNAAYFQCFGGETAECVAEGLLAIFLAIGGVPLRIIFDNATGIGRRVRDLVRFSKLFLRFKCHYGFSVSFCNPESGNEKGNVEAKVGYIRRNFFVPIPKITCLESWNRELFALCERDHEREHYKKGLSIAHLFDLDRAALAPLPAKPFRTERLETVATDGYGKFSLEGRHVYSSAPEYAFQRLTVGLRAHEIAVYRQDGEVLVTHPRVFGSERSERLDWRTSVATLAKRPGAWANSQVRGELSAEARERLDALERGDLRRLLGEFARSGETFGFEVALASLEEASRRGALDAFSLHAVATRVAADGLFAAPASGPDLGAYDRALIPSAAEDAR